MIQRLMKETVLPAPQLMQPVGDRTEHKVTSLGSNFKQNVAMQFLTYLGGVSGLYYITTIKHQLGLGWGLP